MLIILVLGGRDSKTSWVLLDSLTQSVSSSSVKQTVSKQKAEKRLRKTSNIYLWPLHGHTYINTYIHRHTHTHPRNATAIMLLNII